MSELMSGVFKEFFSAIDGVIGNEANYQVALSHYLQKFFGPVVKREFIDKRVGRGGIDVAITSMSDYSISYAFEVKGGAYGNRNALHDNFDSTGYCADFDKLSRLDGGSCERWMIAIDAVELGRGMPAKALAGAVEHAKARNIGFAYYALGDDLAYVVYPDGNALHISVAQNCIQTPYSQIRRSLTDSAAFSELLKTSECCFSKEADIVSSLYSGLIGIGCSSKQISLETYFGFAPGSSMQQRPDLCIYEPDINGHFNLYPNGDRKRSNDIIKLANIRALVEVKGSRTLSSKSDSALIKLYIGDLDKMAIWRNAITNYANGHGLVVNCDYIFMTVDHRARPLSEASHAALLEDAMNKNIFLHYLHIPIQ